MKPAPLCRDCKHYDPPPMWPDFGPRQDCRRSVRVVSISPVTGLPIKDGLSDAGFERSDGWIKRLFFPIKSMDTCGPSGRYFEPKAKEAK